MRDCTYRLCRGLAGIGATGLALACLTGCSAQSSDQQPTTAAPTARSSEELMSPAAAPVRAITEVPASTTLAVGQELQVVLEANATTGYEWTAEVTKGKGAVEVVDTSYQQGPTQMPGSGGASTTRIAASAPGQAVVRFTYARPWDPKDNPTVADLKITVTAAQPSGS